VKAINVESAGELARLEAIGCRLGRAVRVALRVNPDIDAGSHPHISTGLKINKFGVPLDAARSLLATLKTRPSLALVAIHVHVGSQITSLEPLRRAAALAAAVSQELLQQGFVLEYVDVGGGLGVSYDGGGVPSAADYGRALVDAVKHTSLPIVLEPGRAIAAPAGALLARVIDVKPRTGDSELRDHRCRHDRADASGALYGAFTASSRSRRRPPAIITTRSSGRSAKAATSSAAIAICRCCRPATWSRSATPARMARRWRRTTIVVRCRPKYWWMADRGASSAGGRPSRISWRSKRSRISTNDE